jgi:hypothetical protein
LRRTVEALRAFGVISGIVLGGGGGQRFEIDAVTLTYDPGGIYCRLTDGRSVDSLTAPRRGAYNKHREHYRKAAGEAVAVTKHCTRQLSLVVKNMLAARGRQYPFTSNSGAHRCWKDSDAADDRNPLTVSKKLPAHDDSFERTDSHLILLTLEGDDEIQVVFLSKLMFILRGTRAENGDFARAIVVTEDCLVRISA